MARGVRRTAAYKLPEKVKWATHVPILVIPSAGHSRLAEGTQIATGPEGRQRRQDVERRTPTNSKRETEVRLRYPPCCEEHMKAIDKEGVDALIGPQQLVGLSNRLQQHHGHGALLPNRAEIDWVACTDKAPCSDCLETAKEAEAERAAKAVT